MISARAAEVLCRVEGCRNPSRRGGLCWGHLKRRQRQQDLEAEVRARGALPKDLLMEAVFSLIEIKPTDDGGWRRAWDRLRKAAVRYAQAAKPVGRPWAR